MVMQQVRRVFHQLDGTRQVEEGGFPRTQVMDRVALGFYTAGHIIERRLITGVRWYTVTRRRILASGTWTVSYREIPKPRGA